VEITFHPLVQRDLIEALSYYNGISANLADEFDHEVRFVLTQLIVNPLRFHVVDEGVRRANLRRFPYHILYEIRAEKLRVMHIRHDKRNPDYGRRRE
jgi:plasmid stabilization system protein ParE